MRGKLSGISEFKLERYVAGELSRADAAEIEAAASSDPDLAARIQAIHRSNAEILESYPAAAMARKIEERALLATLAPPPRQAFAVKSSLLRVLPLAAVLAVGVGIAILAVGKVTGNSGSDDFRAKGGSLHVSLFRKTASGAERLANGALAFPSDLIQVGYYSGAKGYGAIFSIDGRGTLTFHLPPGYSGGARKSPEIAVTGESVLPSAYELDDAPRFERFFFVFSPKPFGLEELALRAKSLAALSSADSAAPDLPSGLAWSALVVKKGAKR